MEQLIFAACSQHFKLQERKTVKDLLPIASEGLRAENYGSTEAIHQTQN